LDALAHRIPIAAGGGQRPIVVPMLMRMKVIVVMITSMILIIIVMNLIKMAKGPLYHSALKASKNDETLIE
jgi:hypothetical protein